MKRVGQAQAHKHTSQVMGRTYLHGHVDRNGPARKGGVGVDGDDLLRLVHVLYPGVHTIAQLDFIPLLEPRRRVVHGDVRGELRVVGSVGLLHRDGLALALVHPPDGVVDVGGEPALAQAEADAALAVVGWGEARRVSNDLFETACSNH